MHQTRPFLLKVIFLIITSLIMVSNFTNLDFGKREAASEKGILDLSGYDFEARGKLCLDGEWQFFYNRLMKPVGFRDLDGTELPDVYAIPPSLWNYYEIDGKPIPGFGYGTYRLIVKGVTPGLPLMLRILPQSTAYRLYIDETLMAENGVVSTEAKDSAPGYRPHSISITPRSGEFVLTIHISNYVYARGGLWDAPTLGTKEQIEELDESILHRDLFLEGCYAIMFMMFLAIFINRPRNRALLYFAALCVVTASRVLIYGDHLILQYTENFQIITFIEYASRYWFPLLVVLLLNEDLSGRLPKKLLLWVTVLITAVTAATAVLPIYWYTSYARLVIAYDFLVGLVMIGLLLWPGEHFFRKSMSKVFYIYGILSIYICGIYDMFFATTSYVEMTPIGFFVALLAFAFILSITYSDALNANEKVLRELEIESERKLQTELKLLQSQIRPHFLYNALSAIANVCAKDGKKAEQLILDLAYFMQTSFDFSSSERLTSLENELEYIRRYVHIEQIRFGEKIRYSEQIEVPLSIQLPRLIIEPLVENAIRHGISKKKTGGEVKLRIAETQEGISVEVADNGVGMTRETLENLFNGERKSIGLTNIQNRLLRLGGEGLRIESVLNEYTKVSFIIRKEN